MRRIMSIWLPDFPLERLARETPGSSHKGIAFALADNEASRQTVSAANHEALAAGVKPGQGLADARAIVPSLVSRPAEPARDRAALARLSRWTERYGSAFNTDGTDGLWVDITGVAHLYGGELGLLADAIRRLEQLGFTAWAGIGEGLGAASALARYAFADSVSGEFSRYFSSLSAPSLSAVRRSPVAFIAGPSETRAALSSLPVEALRIEATAAHLLRRLGLKRIGQLDRLPRVSLERRFRSDPASKKAGSGSQVARVLLRLDQALGVRPEPLRPMRVIQGYAARAAFGEPLISSQALEGVLADLAAELSSRLEAAGRGARRLVLTLHRSDGSRAALRVGLSRPNRSALHMQRLLNTKLETLDAGFGIDLMQLAASVTEPLTPQQAVLDGSTAAAQTKSEALTALIDRLAGRLGVDRVLTLGCQASHLPERAEVFLPALAGERRTIPRLRPRAAAARPTFLLAVPEPIHIVTEFPEGPPTLMRWRRSLHHIARAQGPERISPEWWRGTGAAPLPERDYYMVEDDTGARFWVFRNGRPGFAPEFGADHPSNRDAPVWYLHGVF